MGFSADLYGGSSNINRIYDIIQELFWKKQNGRPMDDHYGEFNRLAEELRQIFLIMSDVKQMQNQWNMLMVLTYLSTSILFILQTALKLSEALLRALYQRLTS